jgi:hypothetical protein
MKGLSTLVQLLVLCLCLTPAWPHPLCEVEELELRGAPDSISSRSELSAVAMRGGYLLALSNAAIGPQESYQALQVFAPAGDKAFQWVRDEILYQAADKRCVDTDFEAMAIAGDRLYVVGSHSLVHKSQKPEQSYRRNRQILTEFEMHTCPGRYLLAEYRIDPAAHVQLPPRTIDLRRAFGASKLLTTFSALPGKENGIDIEGLAISNEQLYVGFRGPVLRDNFVPILRMKISGEDEAELLFVTLGGRGIRDMIAVPDGFLIIGGATGDQEMPYEIYRWDGKDMVKGRDRPPGGTVTPLCTLPHEEAGKPEGIVITAQSSAGMEAIIVYDGNTRLVAKRARIPLN